MLNQCQVACQIQHQHQDQILGWSGHRHDCSGIAVNGCLNVLRVDDDIRCTSTGTLDPAYFPDYPARRQPEVAMNTMARASLRLNGARQKLSLSPS